MARKAPTKETVRSLFAKSGNVCAFPGCTSELVTEDNLFVGEICHIEAAEPGGPRYNPSSNDEERRAFGNLLVLCHPHHRRIDSYVDEYTIEVLREMKANHESLHARDPFWIDGSVAFQVEQQMQSFWERLTNIKKTHPIPELSIEIDTNITGIEVVKSLSDTLEQLFFLLKSLRHSDEESLTEVKNLMHSVDLDPSAIDKITYYNNPFINRNWEIHNIGSPNFLERIHVSLLHLELEYLREYLKTHTGDVSARARIEEVKKRLENSIANTVLID